MASMEVPLINPMARLILPIALFPCMFAPKYNAHLEPSQAKLIE